MKRQNKIFLLVFLLLFSLHSAQDSLKISASEFISIVKNYHPLALRYQLQNRLAEEEIRRARGNFDPVLAGKLGEKNIDGTKYYEQKNIELGIPTWYGIDLHGSYNHLDGQKLNNSDTRGGLYQFGITVPLAKNLLYDQRRAILDQTRFGLRMTEAEQAVLTNDLLLEAENTYWEWVQNYEIYKLKTEIVEINKDRLKLTRKTFEFGEKPAIDTIEALSQLQSFELQQRDAFLSFVKSTQQLQLYLWKDNQQFYELSEMIYPSDNLAEHQAYSDFEFLINDVNSRQINSHLSVLYYN